MKASSLQLAELVQVLAGVVEIDDLGGFGEMGRRRGSRSSARRRRAR
jgi:hypothetical protein